MEEYIGRGVRFLTMINFVHFEYLTRTRALLPPGREWHTHTHTHTHNDLQPVAANLDLLSLQRGWKQKPPFFYPAPPHKNSLIGSTVVGLEQKPYVYGLPYISIYIHHLHWSFTLCRKNENTIIIIEKVLKEILYT